MSFLLFSSFIKSINSFCVIVSSNKNSSNSIPISSQALLLFLTYVADALSFPTIITASFGLIPSFFSSVTSSLSFSLIFLASSFPFIISILKFIPFFISFRFNSFTFCYSGFDFYVVKMYVLNFVLVLKLGTDKFTYYLHFS